MFPKIISNLLNSDLQLQACLPGETTLRVPALLGFTGACPVKQIRRISCIAGFHWDHKIKIMLARVDRSLGIGTVPALVQ